MRAGQPQTLGRKGGWWVDTGALAPTLGPRVTPSRGDDADLQTEGAPGGVGEMKTETRCLVRELPTSLPGCQQLGFSVQVTQETLPPQTCWNGRPDHP